MSHRRVLRMLMIAGLSGPKAMDIIVDARRNDPWALRFIRLIKAGR